MNKKILIPTDFSIESLTMVKTLMAQKPSHVVYDIILLHGVDLNDSITDLLFFSRSKVLSSLSNPQFEEACAVIQNKFVSEIRSLRKDIFTGTTQLSFNNYLEANRIDEIYLPENYELNLTNKKSFDLIPYIKKSVLDAHEVQIDLDQRVSEKGNLSSLFFNQATIQ